MIKGKLGEEDVCMNAITTTHCPTFVVAKTAANINAQPTIFRTYRGYQVRPSECSVWQAARATSAAPTFFKPMAVDRPRPAITYIDGGMGYNNPAELSLGEGQRLWPESKQFLLVSVGTGVPKANSIRQVSFDQNSQESILAEVKRYLPDVVTRAWEMPKYSLAGLKSLIEMGSVLAQLATNSEDVHQRVQRAHRGNSSEYQSHYFRFNVPRDVGDIGLGDWCKLEELAAHTDNYMKEYETEEQMSRCVKSLLTTISSSK
jgi:hypothetical protein